jgi:hypothetical protein
MKQQKGKVIIDLPRTPANAWLFEKRYKKDHVENEKQEKKDNQADKHSE